MRTSVKIIWYKNQSQTDDINLYHTFAKFFFATLRYEYLS